MSRHSERIKNWLADLRSGDIEQGRDALRVGDSYCCLGVACERYRKDTGNGEWVELDHGEWQFRIAGEDKLYHESNVLPPPVVTYFGFPDNNPDIPPEALEKWENDWYENPTLAEANDKGLTFDTIADIAEEFFLHEDVPA